MPFARTPSSASYAAVADASPDPFWLDDPRRPDPLPPFTGRRDTDLLVVGGGFSGLWTALLAKEADPLRDVVVVEGARVGWAASGRNGGFCEASITHGLDNGLARWPDEIGTLIRLGEENFDGLEAAIARHGIDCASTCCRSRTPTSTWETSSPSTPPSRPAWGSPRRCSTPRPPVHA